MDGFYCHTSMTMYPGDMEWLGLEGTLMLQGHSHLLAMGRDSLH